MKLKKEKAKDMDWLIKTKLWIEQFFQSLCKTEDETNQQEKNLPLCDQEKNFLLSKQNIEFFEKETSSERRKGSQSFEETFELTNGSKHSVFFHVIVPHDSRYQIQASPIIGKLKKGHTQHFWFKLLSFCTLEKKVKLTIVLRKRKNSKPFHFIQIDVNIRTTIPEIFDLSEIKLEGVLGRGGNACVYRGIYRDQPVAVKMIRGDCCSIDRLLYNEISNLRSAQGPNVVKFIGTATDGSHERALVMELMEGGSLYKYLRSHKLNNTDKLNLSLQVATSVVHLHSRQIYHRDIKTANFLVDMTLTPVRLKLTDFGAAICGNFLDARSRKIPGTITHQAPEGFHRDRYALDKADIYSLGVVLWEIYTQLEPYEFCSDHEVISAIYDGGLTLPDSIPQETAQIIRLCLNQNPKYRPDAIKVFQKLKRLASSAE